jgi:pyridoxal phosphate enzyme (YggS family)
MPVVPLPDRLEAIRAQIVDAARQANRPAESITTIVVTKFHPASLVRELERLGVRDFGENRHQEAQAKSVELADLDINWHFIGQLQSKKAKQARLYAAAIHSLDRDSVIDALASNDEPLDVFVQLNLTDDPGRGGVQPEMLELTVERVLATSGIRLLGVMAVAPVDVVPRAAFERVRLASERVLTLAPEARFISAGMSGDFAEAILEGATHLRIGSAITGIRPVAG